MVDIVQPSSRPGRGWIVLTIWYTHYPLQQPANCYRVAASHPRWYRDIGWFGVPHEIQFVAHADLPLPDPTYLHIHAACCRVATLSGADDYLSCILESAPYLDESGKANPAVKYLCYRLVHNA